MTSVQIQAAKKAQEAAKRAAAERRYAQNRTIAYRGVSHEMCHEGSETHGTFCYRGRTYTK